MTMEDVNEMLSQSMIPLRVAKLLKDHGMEQEFEMIRDRYNVDYDDECAASIDALEILSDHVENDYDEESDVSIMYFSDRTIMEYYRLCQEEVRLKNILLRESNFVRRAERAVREYLDAPGCYYCDYKLRINPEKDWGCGIVFRYGMEYFYEFFPLFYNMTCALAFYKENLPALRREVDQLKRPFAIVPYQPKGAAT